MKHSLTLVSTVSLLLCHCASHAFEETWSDDNDPRGWYAFSGDKLSVTQDPAEDNLRWVADDGFMMDAIVADSDSSGGAFVGDLVAKGGRSYSFDLLVDEGSDLLLIQLDVHNQATHDNWRFVLPPPTLGEWEHYVIPFDESTGWEQVDGSQSLDWMLRNVDLTGLVVSEWFFGDAGTSGRLDNFALVVPEPQTLTMLSLAALMLLAYRRKRR